MKSPRIAYKRKLAFGIELEVKASANAWWMDPSKLNILIAVFSIAGTIPEACLAAGITIKQYKYFVLLHPEFSEARKGYKLLPVMKARRTIVNNLDNPRVAMWYLTRTRPEEFGPPSRRKLASGRADHIPEVPLTSEQQKNINELVKRHEDGLRKILIGIPPVPKKSVQ
jgi:hypothetical protein